MGERKSFVLRSVRSTPTTEVSVLGASGEVLEYKPGVDARPKWRQEQGTLELDVMMAQRLYNDRRWPNPLVIRLTNVEAALTPPAVATEAGRRGPGKTAELTGELRSLGKAPAVEVGFEVRRKKELEEILSKDYPWRPTGFVRLSAP